MEDAMSNIIPFDFNGASVRTITDGNGDPWFVAKDVADILGYRDATDATRGLDDDEKGTQSVRTLGGDQDMIVISESGLFAAVLRSQRPEAKAFRKWVTSEVLPSIRKTGKYSAKPAVAQLQVQAKIASLKEIIEVARDIGDDVMVVMVADVFKNSVIPELGGQAMATLPAPDVFQTFEILDAIGLSAKLIRAEASHCGRLLAIAYRTERGEEPSKSLRTIDGAARKVNVYAGEWRGRANDIIRSYLSAKGIAA